MTEHQVELLMLFHRFPLGYFTHGSVLMCNLQFIPISFPHSVYTSVLNIYVFIPHSGTRFFPRSEELQPKELEFIHSLNSYILCNSLCSQHLQMAVKKIAMILALGELSISKVISVLWALYDQPPDGYSHALCISLLNLLRLHPTHMTDLSTYLSAPQLVAALIFRS